MATTGSSDSGSIWSGIASNITQLGLAYGESKLVDVQPTGYENVNGVEVPYYGTTPPPATSGTPAAGLLILLGAAALAAWLIFKR